MPDETNQEISQTPREPLVAFGRFVKPEMYDVFGEYDFSELSNEEKAWMSSDKLRSIILPVNRSEAMCVDGIALNAYEYNLIVRSPRHLGMFATARTLGDNELNDELVAASHRAPSHVFTQKLEKMEIHQQSMKDQRLQLRELHKEASAPGFAHKTAERMKQLVGAAWNEFQTILDVTHIQRGWDDVQRNKAETALIFYLTQGSQRNRVKHWNEMLTLAENYVTARIILFGNRIRAVSREINRET